MKVSQAGGEGGADASIIVALGGNLAGAGQGDGSVLDAALAGRPGAGVGVHATAAGRGGRPRARA